MATCLRCQFWELVEAATFGLVSSAGKGPDALLAIVYCYIYKSNAKKCSHNWRMGGWTGCESDPESAILPTAKSCFIMCCCQCTWETRTPLEKDAGYCRVGAAGGAITLSSLPPFLVGCCRATEPQLLLAFSSCASTQLKTLSCGGPGTVEWGMLRPASEFLPARLVGGDVGYQLLPRSGKCCPAEIAWSSMVLECVYMHFK